MDTYTGKIHQNGAWWHPTYEGIKLPCVNCTCDVSINEHNVFHCVHDFDTQDGAVKCDKLPCPPVPVCTEEHNIHAVVLCCPTCRGTQIFLQL